MSLPDNVKNVVFYSDACGGQNRNSHVSAMFLTALQDKKSLDQADRKFMTSGHSHMECDVDHGLIEKLNKTEISISVPHDWFQLVRTVGKTKKFSVIELKYADFHDFSSLLSTALVLRKKNYIYTINFFFILFRGSSISVHISDNVNYK